MNIPWEWEGFLHWVATQNDRRTCYYFKGYICDGRFDMPTALTAKRWPNPQTDQDVHTLSHRFFYWVVTFPKLQHCIPQISSWLNINPVSSSKVLGQNGVSNRMLTGQALNKTGQQELWWVGKYTPCLKGDATIQLWSTAAMWERESSTIRS